MNNTLRSLHLLFGKEALITSSHENQFAIKNLKSQISSISKLGFERLLLSNCAITDLKLLQCTFQNCTFEKCSFSHTGFWDSAIEHCNFIQCNFRETAFGGIDYDKPTPNRFESSVFDKCDLRRSYHSCEVYENCIFDNSNIDGIDFGGAVFERCKFAGTISNVTFNSEYGIVTQTKQNQMFECDFSESKLRAMLFRGIDLTNTTFADDENLLRLVHGQRAVDKWLEQESLTLSSGQRWFVEQFRKDLGPNTVLDKLWLQDVLGDKQVAKLVEVDLAAQ